MRVTNRDSSLEQWEIWNQRWSNSSENNVLKKWPVIWNVYCNHSEHIYLYVNRFIFKLFVSLSVLIAFRAINDLFVNCVPVNCSWIRKKREGFFSSFVESKTERTAGPAHARSQMSSSLIFSPLQWVQCEELKREREWKGEHRQCIKCLH